MSKLFDTLLNYVLLAILAAAVGSIIVIPAELRRLREAQEAETSAYLCVEIWKLGQRPEACEPLAKARGEQA